MKLKSICLLAALAVLLVVAGHTPVHAQAISISYNQTVTGALDNTNSTLTYQVSGAKNDIVFVQIAPTPDSDGNRLENVAIIVSDALGRELANTTQSSPQVSGFGWFAVAQLPARDTYTLRLVKDTSNPSKGQFTLALTKVDTLKLDKPTTGTLSTKTAGVRYPAAYAIDSRAEYSLQYSYRAQDPFNPSLVVYDIDRAGNLSWVAGIAGKRLLGSSLSFEGSKDLYLVVPSDYADDVWGSLDAGDERTADYTLTVTALTSGTGK